MKPQQRLMSFMCPECRGHIQAETEWRGGRFDNYGWWIVECGRCLHLFPHWVNDGLRPASIIIGGTMRGSMHGDSHKIGDVEQAIEEMLRKREEEKGAQ